MSGGILATRREYDLRPFQKFSYLAFAALFLLGSGFFFKLAIDPIGRDFALMAGVISLIPGLILVSLALRSRLILDGSRIELRSAIRTFSADRNEIEGLRKIDDQYGRRTRICLKESGRAFNVSESFTGNDDLNEWLNGLPDLDQHDADLITQQIQNQNFSVGTENRTSSLLGRAKFWAVGLSIAAGIFSIPVLFVNYAPLHNGSLLLMTVIPPAGIFLLRRYPLVFTLFKNKTDPRAELTFAIVWPGVGMIMSYQIGSDPTHLVNPLQLLDWILVLLALLCRTAFAKRLAEPIPLDDAVGGSSTVRLHVLHGLD